MKKLLKLTSVLMSYLILILFSINATVAYAQENAPKKYMDYSNLGNILEIVQYKDKALAASATYNPTYNYGLDLNTSFNLYTLKNNALEKAYDPIDSDYLSNLNRCNNLVYFNTHKYNSNYGMEFCYNFDNSSTSCTNLDDTIEKTAKVKETALKKVSKKFNYNYNSNNIDYFSFEEIYDLTGTKYTKFNISNADHCFTGVYNDNFQYLSTNTISVDFDNKNRPFITEYNGESVSLIIVDNKNLLRFSINENIQSNIYVVDNHFYFLGEDFTLNSYSFNGNKFSLDKKYTGSIKQLTTDKDGNLWALKNADGRKIVSKLENNELMEKYEVNKDMTNLSVYDDNNMTVYTIDKFTTINNTADNNSDNDKNNIKRLIQTGSPINTKTLLILASLLTTLGGTVFIKKRL